MPRQGYGFRYGFLFILIVLGMSVSHGARAATAYFNPSAGAFAVDTFDVDVLIDTKGVAINNAEAVIRFPSDLLEVVSANTAGSIFSLWVAGTKYSNDAGTLSFNAGKPTPGYNGAAGKILTVTFRIKASGSATLSFASAVIRANDGHGTDVFKSGSSATYAVTHVDKPETPAVTAPVPVVATPEPLTPPVFTDYPSELRSGEQLVVRGATHPASKVSVWLQHERDDQQNYALESDDSGRFTFSADDRVKKGIYRLWAQVTDGQGRSSSPTEKIAVVVAGPAIDAGVALLAVFAVAILLVAWYVWHSRSLARRRIRKETDEAEASLHKAFGSLRENRARLEMFETARAKRTLTAEEEEIVKWLRKDLDAAEETVEKEIVDIEEEIR